jgi:hypothetical protein
MRGYRRSGPLLYGVAPPSFYSLVRWGCWDIDRIRRAGGDVLRWWQWLGTMALSGMKQCRAMPVSRAVRRTGTEHWSAQPMTRPVIPAETDAHGRHNPIDRFILALGQSRGVKPSPRGGSSYAHSLNIVRSSGLATRSRRHPRFRERPPARSFAAYYCQEFQPANPHRLMHDLDRRRAEARHNPC